MLTIINLETGERCTAGSVPSAVSRHIVMAVSNQLAGCHSCPRILAAIDDISTDELVAAPLMFKDGLGDNW